MQSWQNTDTDVPLRITQCFPIRLMNLRFKNRPKSYAPLCSSSPSTLLAVTFTSVGKKGLRRDDMGARGHRFQGTKHRLQETSSRGTPLDFIQIHRWTRREVSVIALSRLYSFFLSPSPLSNSLGSRSGAWREVSGSHRAKIVTRRPRGVVCLSAVWKYDDAFLPDGAFREISRHKGATVKNLKRERGGQARRV